MFRQTFFKKSLAELAKVDGVNKGLKGQALLNHIDDIFKNTPTEIVEQATKDALYGTFNSKNAFADFISKGKGALGEGKYGGIKRGVADFIMPFTQTPTNVAARIIDYSPLGFAKAGIQAASGSGQRNVVESLGRATVGSGIVGSGYMMGKEGNMTGTLPSNETERNLWELQGKQANSVLINGKYYNLDKISPVGNLLGMGANAAQLVDDGKTGSDLYGGIAGQSAKGLTDMTFLKGVSGALNAVTQPDKAGAIFAENTAGSIVPSVIAAYARQQDPTKREVDGGLQAIQNRLPGMRQNLLPKRNALGEEMQYEGNQFFNPFRPSTKNTNSVADEIVKLRDFGGQLPLTKEDDTYKFKGAEIKLTKEETDILKRDAGGLIKSRLEKVMEDPTYQRGTPAQKTKLIKEIIAEVKKITGYNIVGKERLTEELQNYIENQKNNPFYQ